MHVARVNDRPPAETPGPCFADQLRKTVAEKVTDERLGRIIEAMLKQAEQDPGGPKGSKAWDQLMKISGALMPANVTQNNFYYGNDGTGAKTPLGNRIKQYLITHGATKPAVLAVELEADPEEVNRELAAPGRFHKTAAGWMVAS